MTDARKALSPDAPTYTNEHGGKQSITASRLDLFPPFAWFHVGAILDKGAVKYGEWNWLKTTVAENVNHAMNHLAALLMGDTRDDHLGHAACRLMMALDLELRKGQHENLPRCSIRPAKRTRRVCRGTPKHGTHRDKPVAGRDA